MMRGLQSLALTCALSLAIAPVFADGVSKQAVAAGQPSAAARSRDKALLAFQHDLVSVLAPRADALPLLAAAIISRPLTDLPKFNNFHGLIDRAAHAEGAADIDAAISWTRLADCDSKADACPNTSALDQLTTQAPDNAAVWLLKLGEDTRNMKQDAAREDLAKAANAKLYDDYAGTSLKALASSIGVLPPPANTFDSSHASGGAGVQAVLVYGLASAQPQPVLQVTAKLCDSAAGDAAIKTDCLKLGKVLEWGSSPLGRSLGLHLREVLADDPAQQEDAKHARLSLIWQVQNFGQLLGRAQNDAAIAQHLVNIARHGGTEMSVLLTALRDNNIPTEAPADWKPQSSKQPQG
ncbi:hypothetical protein [Rhodanobacter sp. A1T4]|uniref:hypothetical protein n=1 Tax=Rhodanobacter sp. A1T4 TaxID=2723087 RepID=UPI00160D76FA|nr:hypothetical protein [Rhodanobacter sp. A1T4]MBB6247544.1 hypothetical protein [Rhodanobacter sp. A1T4]